MFSRIAIKYNKNKEKAITRKLIESFIRTDIRGKLTQKVYCAFFSLPFFYFFDRNRLKIKKIKKIACENLHLLHLEIKNRC